jgi:hypothetical protein
VRVGGGWRGNGAVPRLLSALPWNEAAGKAAMILSAFVLKMLPFAGLHIVNVESV